MNQVLNQQLFGVSVMDYLNTITDKSCCAASHRQPQWFSLGPPIHPIKEQFPVTPYPRCHFLKAYVVICPPSRDLNADFAKLVEISQSSQMVLRIHHILEGLAFLRGWVRGGLGSPGLSHWVWGTRLQGEVPQSDLILVFRL